MRLSNEKYDFLKWFTTIALPAITAFIGTIGATLDWSYTELTIIVMTALITLLGTLLGVSTSNYNKEGNGDEK